MKKVIFRTLPAVILFVAAIVVLGGCENKNENNNENKKEDKKEDKYPLKNTEWKLVSIFIVEKDSTVIDFKCDNCNDCYKFKFDTDSTAIGKSIYNQLNLTLYDNNKALCATTKILEGDEKANLYCKAIILTNEYLLNDNTLHLNSAYYKIVLKKEVKP